MPGSRKLGRTSDHRNAMLRAMVTFLLENGKIEITSQNHSYAVDVASLAGTELELTHMNLLDRTAEGVASPENRLFSVQYHPESAPGPQDSAYLFDRFIDLMEEAQNHA